MPTCNALTGAISKSCDTNTGGIRKMWITDWTEFAYTQNGSGQIDSLSPSTPNLVFTNLATVNQVTAGFVRLLSTVVVPGNQTAKLASGVWFSFTYNVRNIDGVTITAKQWTGTVLASTYDTVNNVTVISPDYLGFFPLTGQSADPAAPNTNQTVSTFAFFEFAFNRNTSSFEEAEQVNLENGTTYWLQTVNLMLAYRDSIKREAIEKLVAGQKQLVAIILDSNGLYWIMGIDSGLYTTEITGGSGVVKSDKNGYAIVMTAEESLQAFETLPSVVSTFLINAV
jgi:hypothetical protein